MIIVGPGAAPSLRSGCWCGRGGLREPCGGRERRAISAGAGLGCYVRRGLIIVLLRIMLGRSLGGRVASTDVLVVIVVLGVAVAVIVGVVTIGVG